jgi:hypothetical protein
VFVRGELAEYVPADPPTSVVPDIPGINVANVATPRVLVGNASSSSSDSTFC